MSGYDQDIASRLRRPSKTTAAATVPPYLRAAISLVPVPYYPDSPLSLAPRIAPSTRLRRPFLFRFQYVLILHFWLITIPKLLDEEVNQVGEALGWLNVFNPFRPDGHYLLDLSKPDEKRMAAAIIELARGPMDARGALLERAFPQGSFGIHAVRTDGNVFCWRWYCPLCLSSVNLVPQWTPVALFHIYSHFCPYKPNSLKRSPSVKPRPPPFSSRSPLQ